MAASREGATQEEAGTRHLERASLPQTTSSTPLHLLMKPSKCTHHQESSTPCVGALSPSPAICEGHLIDHLLLYDLLDPTTGQSKWLPAHLRLFKDYVDTSYLRSRTQTWLGWQSTCLPCAKSWFCPQHFVSRGC